jgi:hypothetical protein
MEQHHPRGIVARVKDALGIVGGQAAPPSDFPSEDSAKALQTERLRREVGEYPEEKSALELNAESARLEDGE